MLRHLGTACLIVLTLSAVTWAQPRGGGRGFGGGGGFGASPAMLLGIPEVRTELKTTEEQNAKLDALQEEQRSKFTAAFAGTDFQSLQNLPENERAAKFAEMREKGEALRKESDAAAAKILTAEQSERLGQLVIQRQGTAALFTPEVIGKLGLTDDQQSKMRSIQEEARPQGFANFGELSQEERQKLFAELQEKRQKAEADTLALLTAEQKAKWEKLQGAKFEFPQRGFGGGGRGGFGGDGEGGERRRPERRDDN